MVAGKSTRKRRKRKKDEFLILRIGLMITQAIYLTDDNFPSKS